VFPAVAEDFVFSAPKYQARKETKQDILSEVTKAYRSKPLYNLRRASSLNTNAGLDKLMVNDILYTPVKVSSLMMTCKFGKAQHTSVQNSTMHLFTVFSTIAGMTLSNLKTK